VKQVPFRGLERRESGKTILYPHITIILISRILIKLLIKRKMRTIPAETGNRTPYYTCCHFQHRQRSFHRGRPSLVENTLENFKINNFLYNWFFLLTWSRLPGSVVAQTFSVLSFRPADKNSSSLQIKLTRL
jgi:hypothetical protein